MELLPASHYMFVNGVRAWAYMEQHIIIHWALGDTASVIILQLLLLLLL